MNPGLYKNAPMAQYIALEAFSAGLAHSVLSTSPFHAWHGSPWNPARARDNATEADIGTYAHAMLLEGEHSNIAVIDAKDWRTNLAKELRDAAREEGKLPILAHKVREVEMMVEEAKRYLAGSELAGIFDDGAAESTLIWSAEGLKCKARPDWLSADNRICLSYKTTAGSANPESWIRLQLPLYDVGMIHYEEGVRACTGEHSPRVVHLVQEQKAPFKCSLVALSPAFQELATAKYRRALETWKNCLEDGNFPAYPSRICYAEPKAWQMAEMEESLDANGLPATGLQPGYGTPPDLDGGFSL